MISIERFNEIVEEELKLLPEYVFEELNGGVVVDEKVNLHPKRLADDLYIMGTYSTSPVMGKQIVIYYGSFTKTMPYADEATLRLKIRDTLRHEFRHHMETRAGFFGAGTLIDEDKREMDRYYLMHAKRQEASDTANVTVTREATPEKADTTVAAGSQENTPYKPVSTETIGSLPREIVETQENIPSDSDNTEKIKDVHKETGKITKTEDVAETQNGPTAYSLKENVTTIIKAEKETKTDNIHSNDKEELKAGFSAVKFVEHT